jgi:hypothetical protein
LAFNIPRRNVSPLRGNENVVISKIWKCVESTNGVIQVGVEHRKQGVFGRNVSIDVFLRVWKQ